MPVSKGGSSNNQNQNQSGSYTGTGTTTNDGTSTNTSVATSTPTAPAGWESFWNSIQPGQGGFNPTQQGAVDWFTGAMGNPDPANLQGAKNGMNWGANYFQDQVANRTAPTLRNLAQIDPAAYGAPANVGTQQVSAKSGADFMGNYLNPYTQQVVDSSLADFDVGGERAANAFRASNIAGGASGAGSNPVAAGILGGELARGRAATAAQLRSGAFNTAAGLGQGDAGLDLNAQMANQGASLNADQFNYTGRQNRNMFDANLGMAYNDQRDRTARDFVGTQGQIANLGTTGFGIGQGLANSLFSAGGQGQGQNLDWLSAAIPLFAQTNTGTNTGTSSSTGTSTESGGSSGNSSGSARGKSGGLGFG